MARLTTSVIVGAEERLVVECTRTLLEAAGGHEVHVRVTFNHRNPALAAELVRRFREVEVINNTTPAGFATNHNRALLNADADVLLLANDDLEFQPECVARSVEFLLRPENQDVAALSPRLMNADGSLQRSTYRFPTLPRALLDLAGLRAAWIPHNRFTNAIARRLGRGRGRSRFWSHDRTCDVDTFRGAAMFVRTDAWRQVGQLSECTQVGGETAEWHRRCRNAGWRMVFFAEAAALHYGSRTVGRDRLLQSEYLKGYLVYFARHRPPAVSIGFRVGGLLIALARFTVAALIRDRIGTRLWWTNLVLIAVPPRPGTT